jgi:hypothetical protein
MSIFRTGGPDTVNLLAVLEEGFEVALVVAGLREGVSGLAMSTAGEVVVLVDADAEAVADLDPEGSPEDISAASFRFLATSAAASSADGFEVDDDDEDEADFPDTVEVGFMARCCCCEVDAGPERESSEAFNLRF